MSLLRAEKLRKSFSGRLVVDDVSFQLERAEIVGLLGRNGAGKTTSFRMAIGMLNADGGRVYVMDIAENIVRVLGRKPTQPK